MGFTVQHQPPMAPVAGVAYDTGRGYFQQHEQQRADVDRHQQNQLDASVYQQQVGVAANAWQQQNNLAADRERLVVGAQVQALREAQGRAQEYYAQQAQLEQQKDLFKWKIGQQQQAEEREFTLKQERELAAIDNAVQHVEQQRGLGAYSDQQAAYLQQQLAARRAGVQPMPVAPQKPALPGDWQPGMLKSIGGSQWYMSPDGKPVNLGGIDDPGESQKNVNGATVTIVDPVTGQKRGAILKPNGEPLFLDEGADKMELDRDKLKLDRDQFDAEQKPKPFVLSPKELLDMHKQAIDALTYTDEKTGIEKRPNEAQRKQFVDQLIAQAKQLHEQAQQQMQGGGSGPGGSGGQQPDPASAVEAQAIEAAVEQAVQMMVEAQSAFGIEPSAADVQSLRERLIAEAKINPPRLTPPTQALAFPAAGQPPQQGPQGNQNADPTANLVQQAQQQFGQPQPQQAPRSAPGYTKTQPLTDISNLPQQAQEMTRKQYPQPKSKAELSRLKKGTIYIAPDGTLWRKK